MRFIPSSPGTTKSMYRDPRSLTFVSVTRTGSWLTGRMLNRAIDDEAAQYVTPGARRRTDTRLVPSARGTTTMPPCRFRSAEAAAVSSNTSQR